MSYSIGVAYLSRYGNPPHRSRAFFNSLLRCNKDAPFSLILIEKGYPAGQVGSTYTRLPTALRARLEIVRVADDGYDLAAYRQLAERRSETHLLFFNSYSRILHGNWLHAFTNAWRQTEGRGLIGASGSWETASPEAPFPNHHIRTNGFLIARETYLGCCPENLLSKRDCNLFEAGPNSLSRQVQALEQPLLTVDASNSVHLPEQWPDNGVFRSRDQEMLLVADNRTHKFDIASPKKRCRDARLAWGARANVHKVNQVRRLRRALSWRFDGLGR